MFFRRKKKKPALRKLQPHFSRRISHSAEYRAMSALERQNYIRQDKSILDPKRPDQRFTDYSSIVTPVIRVYEDEFYRMYMYSTYAPIRCDKDLEAAVNADRFRYNVNQAKIGPSLAACTKKCVAAEEKLNQIQNELAAEWEAELDRRFPNRHKRETENAYMPN